MAFFIKFYVNVQINLYISQKNRTFAAQRCVPSKKRPPAAVRS